MQLNKNYRYKQDLLDCLNLSKTQYIASIVTNKRSCFYEQCQMYNRVSTLAEKAGKRAFFGSLVGRAEKSVFQGWHWKKNGKRCIT